MSKTLVVYLMCGRDTVELAEAAVEGGADILELGIPFSDPLGEGPVLRVAAERALAEGMTTDRCLDCVSAVRSRLPQVPIVPMTYAAIVEAYGYKRFEQQAREAGASNFILLDVPVEEHPEFRRIQLVAPTSTEARITLAAKQTDGWLYVISVTGTTGVRSQNSPQLEGLVSRVREIAPELPLYAGFGISTPEQAQAAATLADGVAVGTQAVVVGADGPNALRAYIKQLRVALDAVVVSGAPSSYAW